MEIINKYFLLLAILLLGLILFFYTEHKKEPADIITTATIDDDNLNRLNNNQVKTAKEIANELQGGVYAEIKSRFSEKNGIFLDEKGRVVSESQSYGMLISVLSEDRESFDEIWRWTKNNLQVRPKDKLFSWLWQNGKVSDPNPATDADQDIAYALFLAYEKWEDESYLTDARRIISDIWTVETEEIMGARYVSAGNWAVNDTGGIIINPSYLAPYQYRIFAQIDPIHDWMSLVDSSYKALTYCTGSAGLAQDWCKLNNQGEFVKNFRLGKDDSSVYSYDALRVPYRIALDYHLNKEPRAFEYLNKNKVFAKDWNEAGKIFAVYNQQGKHLVNYESLASYGAQLASMSVINDGIAQEILDKKIKTIDSWEKVSFYDLSWIWFGLNFYEENKQK